MHILPTQYKHQEGVTLLISVLIMSTIMLISVTISAFVIQEIRAARSSMLTEPAIIGAETAGEQGLFFLKQTGSIPGICTGNSNGGTSTLNDTSCSSSKVRVGKTIVYGPVTLQLTAGELYEFFLYDPVNIQSNTAMVDGSNNPLFRTVSVQHVSGTPGLNTDVSVISNTVGGTPVASDVVSVGGVFTFDSFNIIGAAGNDKRQLVSLSVAEGVATVVVSSTGSFGSGIPNFPTIQADSCSANVSISNCNNTSTEVFRRRINITVPTTQ